MITYFFIPELNNHDVQGLWFQQDGATYHTARATIDLLKDTFGDRLISRFGPVNWPPRSCDLTPLDYFLWGYVKSLVYADKSQTLDHLEDNMHRVIADIRPQMLEKVIENWTSRLDYIRASRASHMPEIIFKIRLSESNREESEESADEINNIPVNPDIYVVRNATKWIPHNSNGSEIQTPRATVNINIESVPDPGLRKALRVDGDLDSSKYGLYIAQIEYSCIYSVQWSVVNRTFTIRSVKHPDHCPDEDNNNNESSREKKLSLPELNYSREITTTTTRLRTKHFKGMKILPEGSRSYAECMYCLGKQLEPKHLFSCPFIVGALFKINNDYSMDILHSDSAMV
ncbi:DUF4817 domain-containing protein [Trichonephila clavipes]|nr:DUF4817 domain-containing protein [Trichonephila clavipes]